MATLFKSINVYHYLNQGEWWYPNGKPRVRIATEMGDRWRENAANWLVKNAWNFEIAYTSGEIQWLESGLGGQLIDVMTERPASMMPGGDAACDAFDALMSERAANPEEWIKTTTLYKALVGEESDG